MRFDPHVPPPRVQDRAVCYTALEVPTVLAEVFQTTRTINRSRGSPWLTAWTPIRDLALLNLTGDWPIRNGASYSINTGRKDHCRRWAEAIHTAWPELDGLLSHSSMTGRPMVTLFTHAHGTFPERPSFSRALADLGLREDLAVAARQIRYDLV